MKGLEFWQLLEQNILSLLLVVNVAAPDSDE